MEAVGGRRGDKKRIKGDPEKRNLLCIARDLGRFPSEVLSVGESGFRITIAAPGWLGKWLRFDGVVEDLRPPIQWSEVLDMMGLYLLEKEEHEEAAEKARQG